MNRNEYLKLVIFVPQSHLEKVKKAVFAAGAGVQGDYRECCWQSPGTGQFRPGAGANPYLGSSGELHEVAEYRVEMLVSRARAKRVVAALRDAHPYEEPAFELLALVDIEQDL